MANLSPSVPVQIEDKRLRQSLVVAITERVAQVIKVPSWPQGDGPRMLRGVEGEKACECMSAPQLIVVSKTRTMSVEGSAECCRSELGVSPAAKT